MSPLNKYNSYHSYCIKNEKQFTTMEEKVGTKLLKTTDTREGILHYDVKGISTTHLPHPVTTSTDHTQWPLPLINPTSHKCHLKILAFGSLIPTLCSIFVLFFHFCFCYFFLDFSNLIMEKIIIINMEQAGHSYLLRLPTVIY